jgi:uncharacterized protein (TIGR03437 family)
LYVCFTLTFVCASLAQTTPFSGRCQAASTPLLVHSEGLAERIGDIGLQCSGATSGSTFSANLTLFLPVNITNRIDATNLTRDAVISVDLGGGFTPTAVPGQVSGNSITFSGVTFTAPASGNVNLRVSGIRAAIAQSGAVQGSPISALLSANLSLNQNSVIVAYPQTGLLATLYSSGISSNGSPFPDTVTLSSLFEAGTAFASTRLTEGFASAFEVRSSGSDTGTRFLIKYSGFAAGTRLYVPDFVAGSNALTPTAGGDLDVPRNVGQYVPGSNTLLLARMPFADATGTGGALAAAPTGSSPILLNGVSEVALTNGSGYAVYEVVDTNSNAQETVQFPTFVALARSAGTLAQETVSLAPASSVGSASQTAPVPRFLPGTVASDCTSRGDCNASYFPKLMVDATPLKITAIEKGGATTTPTQYFRIRNDAGGLLNWNVSITYQTGSGWLVLGDSSGVGNATVRVDADTKSLSAGTYQAVININAGSAGSQTIPLTLTVAAAPPPPPPPPVVTPTIVVSKVVNAATFAVTPLVAGSLGTVMGSHFTGSKLTVTFDGVPATVLFAGESQINLQVPLALGSKTSANLVVTVDGASSTPFPVTLSPAWPSIFAHGVLNQDNQENTPASAARPGSILQIFATGIPKDATVSVQFGGRKDLVPVYAGEAPGFAGLQQVNVAVPQGATAANLLLCATVAGQQYCSAGYAVAVQ